MPQVDNEQIVDAALELVGWPYRHAGRNEHGTDCIGVVILAAHKCGIATDYDTVNYPKRPVAADLRRGMKDHLKRLTGNEELQSGDIPMFAMGGSSCHVGILNCRGSQPTVIHAYAPARKVIEQTLESICHSATHVATFRYTGE